MADENVTRRAVLGASAPRSLQPTRQANAPRPAAAGVTIKSGLSVTVVEDLTDLEPYVSAWEGLAATALEPNVFYEPWMLMPAITRARRWLRGNTCPWRIFCGQARAWIMASEMRLATTSRTSKNCSGPRRNSYERTWGNKRETRGYIFTTSEYQSFCE